MILARVILVQVLAAIEEIMIKNYSCYLMSRDNGKWTEGDRFEIAFVDKCGYDLSVDELFQLFQEIKLPKDIMIKAEHDWVGSIPENSPFGQLQVLRKDNYIDTENLTKWGETYRPGIEKHLQTRKIYVTHRDHINHLRVIIWNESKLSPIVWTMTEEERQRRHAKSLAMGSTNGFI